MLGSPFKYVHYVALCISKMHQLPLRRSYSNIFFFNVNNVKNMRIILWPTKGNGRDTGRELRRDGVGYRNASNSKSNALKPMLFSSTITKVGNHVGEGNKKKH